jgi:hypothetical protein
MTKIENIKNTNEGLSPLTRGKISEGMKRATP